MRIFYASDSTPNAAVQSNLWRNNLYMPLVDLGHEVVEFDYDLTETFRHLDTRLREHQQFIHHNRPKVSEALVQQVRAEHQKKPIDLFFSYFYDACVLPEAIEEIKSLGIPTVNWFCNGSYQLYLVQEISPHYDWCLVPEKFRLKDYEAMGARPIYCQEAANPNIYHPTDVPKEYDVTFVGQGYGDRPALLRALVDAGVAVRVWGAGWERYHPVPPMRQVTRAVKRAAAMALGRPVGSPYVTLPTEIIGGPLSDAEMVTMYSRSKINLGFSSCGDTHLKERILQVRLRDFEVPMSGGFYMVEYMEELEEFYEIGKEIVCYRNTKDLVEKVNYYLKHDAEREAIRNAGYERCRRDHTWHKRFQDSFGAMELA